ncbi:MAG: hypothetical protein GXP54_02285, partial [Deltaproteobacteria bacterium]|nr:hypothetical protein [Deltaproteobacteria bacterium]
MRRESTTSSRIGFWAFWVLMAGLLVWNTWAGSQFPSDDCIYAQIGREVLEKGRWLDPTWQGVPFLDKGPVLSWALAGS